MNIVQTNPIATKPVAATITANNCCGACATRAGTRNAHCGKTHSIEELVRTGSDLNNFYLNRWQLDSLVDYIHNEHHQYFYNEERVITELLKKIVDHPVIRFPGIQGIVALIVQLKTEIGKHLFEVEEFLYPHVRKMVAAKRNGLLMSAVIYDLAAHIRFLKTKHTVVGSILENIQSATNDYSAFADEPDMVGSLFKKLQAMHNNLDQHLFIENNILFPKALLLQGELRQVGLI